MTQAARRRRLRLPGGYRTGGLIMEVEDALDLVDRANNVILSCQARCIDHVVVEA